MSAQPSILRPHVACPQARLLQIPGVRDMHADRQLTRALSWEGGAGAKADKAAPGQATGEGPTQEESFVAGDVVRKRPGRYFVSTHPSAPPFPSTTPSPSGLFDLPHNPPVSIRYIIGYGNIIKAWQSGPACCFSSKYYSIQTVSERYLPIISPSTYTSRSKQQRCDFRA